MKTQKLTKRIQIILATLFVLIVGTIIVGICLSNRTMASAAMPTCGRCGSSNRVTIDQTYSDGTQHKFVCANDGWETYGNHDWNVGEILYEEVGDKQHRAYYACNYQGCSQKYYSASATNCTGGELCKNKGCCEVCGRFYTTYEHQYSGDIYFKNLGDGTHQDYNKCLNCGYEDEISLRPTSHYGGESNHEGKCTAPGCGAEYLTHERAEWGYYEKTPTTHELRYECKYHDDGCTYIYTGYTPAAHSGGIHKNEGICTVEGCGYKYQTHSQSTTIAEYTDITETTHTPKYKCTYEKCDQTAPYKGTAVAHTYTDGKCVCGAEEPVEECEHTYITDNDDTQHWQVCSKCNEEKKDSRVNHAYTTYKDNGNGTHSATCTGCTNVKTTDHTYTNGKCACGATESTGGDEEECTHPSYVTKSDSDSHWEACSSCGEVKDGTDEPHSGATHDNGGICTAEGCGYKYENHGMNTYSGVTYEITEDKHKAIYKCTFLGCNGTHEGWAMQHMGGSHSNGGKCMTCQYQYQSHVMSTVSTGWETTETTHAPVYKCTYSMCSETETGTAVRHSGGSHSNGGECTTCEYQYEEHGQSEVVSRYETTSENHTPIYACKFAGCQSTYNGEAETHKEGTHDNGGKCTTCQYQYQSHVMSTVATDWNVTDTTHTPVYECSYSGCTKQELGTPESHKVEEWTDNTNGTHSGDCKICESTVTKEHRFTDGVCPDCNATEEVNEECEHEYEMQSNQLMHWNQCTKCNKVETGSLEAHKKFADGEDSGVASELVDNGDGTHSWNCVVCDYEITEDCTYDENDYCIYCEGKNPDADLECTHEWTEENDETQHWEECTKCGERKEGTTENHTYEYTNKGNGTHDATCTECDYTETQECTYQDGACSECNGEDPNKPEVCNHTYEMKNNETQHWQECTKCGEKKEGTTANHTYEYTDNGNETHKAKCTICNYETSEEHDYQDGTCADCNAKDESADNQCEHTYELKKNEQQHWEECSKCGAVKEDSLQNHTYGNFIDNENNTHSGVCLICEYVITESHDYQNGKCTDCNAKDPDAECEHNYEMKSNTTTHWEECTKCKQAKAGTVEKHTFTNYTDNGDGTHTGTCSTCKYKLKDEHDYKNEECIDCKAKQEKTEEKCEHVYVVKNDGDNHWAECTKCKEVKAGSLEKHTYGKCVDNKNGTHTKVCSDCGYKYTESHKEEICEECGSATYPKDEEPKDENPKQPTTQDPTTTDKEIPKAGLQSAIAIAVITLAAVSGITVIKMKKYKDI